MERLLLLVFVYLKSEKTQSRYRNSSLEFLDFVSFKFHRRCFNNIFVWYMLWTTVFLPSKFLLMVLTFMFNNYKILEILIKGFAWIFFFVFREERDAKRFTVNPISEFFWMKLKRNPKITLCLLNYGENLRCLNFKLAFRQLI